MELGPRDRLSQAFMKELEKGRTIDTPYGPVVHLDLRHLGAKKINAKIPFVRELCMKYQNLDPVKDLIPVRPVVHYMMGGVHTDINGATPLPGLYAAGETACVSINGANRLGSNSLPELLVFGARAGKAAAEYASHGLEINPRVIAQKTDEQRRLEHDLLNKKGRERIADLRDEMQKRWSRAPASTAPARRSRRASTRSAGCSERYADIAIEDRSRTFNTERIAALELAFMLDVAEADRHRGGAPRRIARRAPAHRFSEARRRALSRALADLPQRRRLGARRVPAGHDHPLAAGRAGLWGGGTAWRTASRYRSRGIVRSRSLRPPSTNTRSLPEGLGRPGRTEPRQGSHRRHAVVPLVVPHGHLRQLRHDGQRRAEADLRHVPVRLRARTRSASSRCAISRSSAT